MTCEQHYQDLRSSTHDLTLDDWWQQNRHHCRYSQILCVRPDMLMSLCL